MRYIFRMVLILFSLFLLTACQAVEPVSTPSATPPIPPTTTTPAQTTALSTPIPTYPESPVYIKAFCTIIGEKAVIEVRKNVPVVVTWGWEAKTKSQLDDFVQNSQTTITLDGKTLEGTINPEVTSTARGDPEIAWYAAVGVLDAGEHSMTYDITFKNIVDDGTTMYGPGGKVESIHDKCQVSVQ